jgi:primosomal protein N' (replication factor Y)
MLASPEARPTLASVCQAAGCTERVVKDMAAEGDLVLTPPNRWHELTAPTAQVAAQIEAGEFDKTPRQKDALQALVAANGALPAGRLSAAIVKSLAERDLIREGEQPAIVALPPRYLTRTGQIDPAALLARLIVLRGGEKALHTLRLLAREGDAIPINWIEAQTGADLDLLRDMAEDGLILLSEDDAWRDPLAEQRFAPTVAPPFTRDQEAVWAEIAAHMNAVKWHDITPLPDEPHTFLLHGITGSGKTEIYLRAVEHTLAHGRGAIVLVPEIALTPQTVSRFAARFPGQVTVIHGDLSAGERFDAWRRARSGEIRVIVGTRSALFTPLPDLGLIVLDEEHDASYKQSPPLPPPYYHARDVAIELARRSQGTVILGSATPSLESTYLARRGLYHPVVLPVRVAGHRGAVLQPGQTSDAPALYRPGNPADARAIDLPAVEVIDMRAELKSGNTTMFSRALQSALTGVLQRREQAILFLNRRGSASYVFCRDCGYVATCPRCEMPLTYHEAAEMLRCHHCGHREGLPDALPGLPQPAHQALRRGNGIRPGRAGGAVPGRPLDPLGSGHASHHRDHDAILTRFAARDSDVLIGTQMIAKGLDLPAVTLVGVLNADVGLALPDFRAAERTFQLLTRCWVGPDAGSCPAGGSSRPTSPIRWRSRPRPARITRPSTTPRSRAAGSWVIPPSAGWPAC